MIMSKAAVKRILQELYDPYDGIMYENGKPRLDKWARIRVSDLEYVAEALREKARREAEWGLAPPRK
jgi:hypothetical protein